MNAHDYWIAVRRGWLVVLISTVCGVALALAAIVVQNPVYTATAKAFVSTQTAASTSDLSQGGTFTQQIVASYADVALTPYVLQPVISKLNLDETSDQLAQHVSASAPLNTVIIELAVTDPSPTRAASIADAIAQSLTERVADLAPQSVSSASAVKITQIQRAGVPRTPDEPKPLLYTLVGFLLGLVIGLGIAVLRKLVDTRIHDAQDISAVTHVPVLGMTSFNPSAASQPIVATQDRTARSEQYRTLRSNIQFVDLDSTSRQMVVTSSMASEGKSTTAANLAVAMAQAGARVLLVDADLRRPTVAEYLGLDASTGLTDILINESSWQNAVQDWGGIPLKVLPAGRIPPNPNELIQSDAMGELVNTFGQNFDFVIYDTPPLLPVSDGALLARRVGGAVLVVASGRTRRRALQTAVGSLHQADARIFGIVATMVSTASVKGGGYGYASYYGYSPTLSSD